MSPSNSLDRRLVAAVGCLALTAGCGLNSAVIQPGGNGRTGVLLNYSHGAQPCDPIDPSRPTIVFTHGWNPLPNHIHTTLGSSSADVLRERCPDSYNLLSWDWNGVRIKARNDGPYRTGVSQGRRMAAALRARGVDPCHTQIIAHSLGSVVAAEACRQLAHCQGPVRQLTLLDPPRNLHERIFCELGAPRHATLVENYWSPGISGFGAEAEYPGVRNYRVKGSTPLRGLLVLSLSNHVDMMLWYYRTVRFPEINSGFQNSVFRR